jgi:hypothetical protein
MKQVRGEVARWLGRSPPREDDTVGQPLGAEWPARPRRGHVDLVAGAGRCCC